MAGKSPSASKMKVEPIYISPQMWAFGPMATVFGAVGLTEIARSSLEFISERVAKDIQAQHDFFNCKSLEDVLRLQTEFALDASQQYAKHFQRMTEILSEAAALGWNEASVKRAREYDDIPL